MLSGLLWLGCTTAPDPPRNVLLVSVDTLRADHLGLYGYARETSPTIDRLGAEGVVFEHAVVQWPVTTPSMASMFSGQYPHVTGIVIAAGDNVLPDRLHMLAEGFRDRGFRTSAVVANGVLGRHNNFDQGFETYHELWKSSQAADPAARTTAGNVTDVALEELAKLTAGGEPFLLWVHYIDPHAPYQPPPGYAERYLGDALYRETTVAVNPDDEPWGGMPRRLFERSERERNLARYVAAYDGEIRYADEQLGRLVERLEALPAGAETLVALVSDHGESLGEHGFYFNHGHVPYEEQVRVPLVLRWPDRRHAGLRVGQPVEVRGLARTLLAAVGAPAPDNPFEGANLLAAVGEGDGAALPARVFSEAGSEATRRRRSYTLAVRRGDLKLVLPRTDWARERHGGRDVELYDLASDPAEERDLAPQRADEAAAIRQELVEWFHAREPWPIRRRHSPARADAFTQAALRELGYVR